MPSANYNIVRQAIVEKRLIRATYNGYPRELCPHVIGLSKKGQEQALFYQFGGHSSSGLDPDGSPLNWRCMAVNALRDIEIIESDEKWHTAPNHSQPQNCVYDIDTVVTY